jgi:hypothetical protein
LPTDEPRADTTDDGRSRAHTHTIRLRGAWESAWDAEQQTQQHSRKFGRPRTLDSGERVWLVCEHVSSSVEVYLNGNRVYSAAEAGRVAVEITDRLQPRNQVQFRVANDQPLGEVALQIITTPISG